MSMQDLREFNKFVSDDGYVDEAGAKRLLVELGATSTDKATASLFRTYATVEYDANDWVVKQSPSRIRRCSVDSLWLK